MDIKGILKQAFLKTSDSIVGAKAVTLDAEFGTPSRGIMVGVAGNVAFTMTDGSSVILPNLTAGVVHRISATKVITTGTTATGIFALY